MNSIEPTATVNPEIDYRSNLSYEEFAQNYLYPHKPVVITDALRSWRALSRWSPEFFKREFGDMQFTIDTGKNGVVEFTMDSFIDRVIASNESNPAPYFRNRVFHQTFPSLAKDVEPLPPYIFPNWMSERFLLKNVQGKLNRGGLMEIYIGGKGGAFPYLHYDGMATHAFLIQIFGQKRFILFDPEQEQYLYPARIARIIHKSPILIVQTSRSFHCSQKRSRLALFSSPVRYSSFPTAGGTPRRCFHRAFHFRLMS